MRKNFYRYRVWGRVLLLAALFAPAVYGQGGPVPPAELDRIVPALMDTAEVTGLALALVVDGEVAWAKGYGVRSIVTKPPVEANTVFEAASLSKPVFAYAVLQLVEQGTLDLDAPLAGYLLYEDLAADPRSGKITARMVLSHTTGFPNWRPQGGALTINFEPGSRFSYSGEGFVYLQRVVEHLTGKPLHVFMQEAVFDPLGMTESSYVWEERFGGQIAAGHREDGSAFDKFTPQEGNAAWSLHTTAPDFARFLTAILGNEGLSEQTVRLMLTPQVDREAAVNWGLGWGLQHTRNGLAFWHWGDNTGYKAFTMVYPAQRRGMVFFSNSNNAMLILPALLKATLGGEQPAVAWLDYERYDDPKWHLGREIRLAMVEGGIEAGLARYEALKGSYPSEAYAEEMLNSLGYRLLRSGKVEEAVAVFQRNVRAYPDSYNVYDSLGEAYMVRGDVDDAIANYERSLKLDPENDNAVEMLKRLRAQKAGQ